MKKFILSVTSIVVLVSLTGCRRDKQVVATPAPQQPAPQVYHKEIVTYADAQQERESGVVSDRQVEWTQEDFE